MINYNINLTILTVILVNTLRTVFQEKSCMFWKLKRTKQYNKWKTILGLFLENNPKIDLHLDQYIMDKGVVILRYSKI